MQKMKKILFYAILILGIIACENQEQPFNLKYDFQAVYFPYQLPLRTLSLGEDRIDNSLDKQFKFDIAASIAGMYENNNSWTIDYVVDNTLADSVYHSTTKAKILALPSSYYTLDPLSTITIPKGLFNGRVRVQLTEAFFNDTIALTGNYVVPLKITDTSADSILEGKPAISNPDPRISSEWDAGKSPKNWVLYGIKFINAYHGTYLQRGRDIISTGGTPIDTITYRQRDVERDIVVTITSIGKTRSVTNFIQKNQSLTGAYSMTLEFANMWGTPGGAITITPRVGSTYAVTGTGQFFDKATSTESWIGLKWQSMHINYTYNDTVAVDSVHVHNVSDTLVFRDRMLKFEQNAITVNKAIP